MMVIYKTNFYFHVICIIMSVHCELLLTFRPQGRNIHKFYFMCSKIECMVKLQSELSVLKQIVNAQNMIRRLIFIFYSDTILKRHTFSFVFYCLSSSSFVKQSLQMHMYVFIFLIYSQFQILMLILQLLCMYTI